MNLTNMQSDIDETYPCAVYQNGVRIHIFNSREECRSALGIKTRGYVSTAINKKCKIGTNIGKVSIRNYYPEKDIKIKDK